MRRDTRNVGLILLCDIETDLIRQPEEPDGSHLSDWGPKTYHDTLPWTLCAVLYVQWRGGPFAERLGIGEVAKLDWKKTDALIQPVYLV